MSSTIQSATFVPPPVDEMHQALDNLEKFIQALSGIPQLVRAGLIHYQFDAIRPFRDRNGHMGSLLAISMLSEGGLI